jgi:hypothetical protein
MNFRSTHVFSVKRAGNIANFAADGIINRRTYRNSLCSDKNKHYVTSYVMVYKAVRHVWLRRMRSSPALLHWLPEISGSYFPNSPRTIKRKSGTYRDHDLVRQFRAPKLYRACALPVDLGVVSLWRVHFVYRYIKWRRKFEFMVKCD